MPLPFQTAFLILASVLCAALSLAMFVGLPFEWGMRSSEWARLHHLPKHTAALRAVALPLAVAGCWWWLRLPIDETVARYALPVVTLSAYAGERWHSRSWEPKRLTSDWTD